MPPFPKISGFMANHLREGEATENPKGPNEHGSKNLYGLHT